MFDILKNRISFCEEKCVTVEFSEHKKESSKKSINDDSVIDVIRKIPINPYIDSNQDLNKYEYTREKKPIERFTGARVYEENDEKENKKNKPLDFPFPINNDVLFEKSKIPKTEDRININYSNIASDVYPEEGFKDVNKQKHFSSEWEMLLAHNHGLYNFKDKEHNKIVNRDRYILNTENDIRNQLNMFVEKVNVDNSNDTCKYLAIEEYKCLLSHSFHMNPLASNEKCVKWFNEYVQCKWDEHKLINGYNYIEDRRHKKSKAYIAAPDYQYS